jgi:hypothetical protein
MPLLIGHSDKNYVTITIFKNVRARDPKDQQKDRSKDSTRGELHQRGSGAQIAFKEGSLSY